MPTIITAVAFATLLTTQSSPELVVSVGHAGGANRAAFVAGYLATASWSNVSLIDLKSGLTVARLAQGSLVMALEGSPDGSLLAVGTCDRAINLWDVRSRTLVRRLPLGEECADSLSFSPDGALLASAADGCCTTGKGVQLWNVRSGHLERVLASDSHAQHVAFSGNGRRLASVARDGTLTIHEWPTGRMLRSFAGLGDVGYSNSHVVVSPDGRYVAWCGNGLRAWDIDAGAEVPLPGAREVTIEDRPPDGPTRRWTEQQVLATLAQFLDDGRLAYIDGSDLLLRRLPDGPQQVISLAQAEGDLARSDHVIMTPWLALRRDGTLLAGDRSSRTVVVDVVAGRGRVLNAPAIISPTSLRWSRSGILAWADLSSALRGWDDRFGRPAVVGIYNSEGATALAFSPDTTRIALAGTSSLSIVDVATRRVLASRDLGGVTETGVAFSPDGLRVAFATAEGLGLFDSNLRPRRLIAKLERYTSAEHVAFSPDGRWIAAALSASHPSLRVWPAREAGAEVTLDTNRLTYGPQPPAFSSDSRRLASFTRGETLAIWTPGSWQLARSWTLPGTGRALAFAPSGTRLAIAADGEAAIWDAETGRKLVALRSPGSAEMREIAWSPDGGRIVAAADDGVLRFWNAATGAFLASLYVLDESRDWLLVAADGRLDGTDWALTRLVAWRTGDGVATDAAVTSRYRVRGLWRSLFGTPRP